MREGLPYRPNTAIIAFRENKFLLINRYCDPEGAWKFPQGGIDNGEDVLAAALREFQEELGTNNLNILGVSKHTNKYEWPNEQISRHEQKSGKRFRGQHQRFVIARYTGDEEELAPADDEVRQHKWVSKKDVLNYNEDEEHLLFNNYNGIIKKILEEFNL
jgi:putative (di)nucleoside polyphosphate hydrolase